MMVNWTVVKKFSKSFSHTLHIEKLDKLVYGRIAQVLEMGMF
jgi:hypothetical protein